MGRVILLLTNIFFSHTSTFALHQPQAPSSALIGGCDTHQLFIFRWYFFVINELYLRRDLRPNQLWCYQGSQQSKFKSWTVSLSLSIRSEAHGPPNPRVQNAVISCNYHSMIEREKLSTNANGAAKLNDLTVIIICDLWKFKKYWRQFVRLWAWWWW